MLLLVYRAVLIFSSAFSFLALESLLTYPDYRQETESLREMLNNASMEEQAFGIIQLFLLDKYKQVVDERRI